ncbi:hypothetical protein Trydic_g5708 [Trypoxylus dichotomus]
MTPAGLVKPLRGRTAVLHRLPRVASGKERVVTSATAKNNRLDRYARFSSPVYRWDIRMNRHATGNDSKVRENKYKTTTLE